MAGLPDVPLDGELWIDRKQFQRTTSIVRRQDKSEHWKAVAFVVFDAPAMPALFEERLAFVSDHLRRHAPPYARALGQELCRGLDHLRQELTRIEALGGEGLMLRQPHSRYEVGGSATLLKVKSFHDAEARVIGHQEGKGRHKGRLGALEVELPDGTRFSVGTGFTDAERESPPAVGSVITFRYQELSEGGVPRFPSYVGVHTAAGPTATTPGPATPTTGTRYFEFVDGKSNRFWEVAVAGREIATRWGRLGTDGQTTTKSFADEAAARAAADRLIAEKTGKGYVEK
jgi:DNA ligase-1